MQIDQPPAKSFAFRMMISIALLLVFPACSVRQEKGASGDGENVDINTPVGNIHVGKDVQAQDTGLPVYPGARLKPKQDDSDDSNAANVHISSGFFGLKVAAIDYETDDSPEKVVSFYQDKLKKFGSVLECHSSGRHDYGVNSRNDDAKSHELKCEGDKTGSNIELKVGSEENQHVVSIQPRGKGTEFGLVFVQMHGKGTI